MSFSKELPKRLLNAKQILNHGIDHGTRNGELNRLFSIISLDGAIENFLYIVIAELGGVIKNTKNPSFNEVFAAAEEAVRNKYSKTLPLKIELVALHQTRNEAQHNAVLPDLSTIKRFVVYASDFLIKSFLICFNIKFDEIHLTDAISDKDLRNIVRQGEDARLIKKDFPAALCSYAHAFIVLQRKKQEHEMWRKKIDTFVNFRISNILQGLSFNDKRRGSERTLRDFLESVVAELEYLNTRLEVVSLGANIQEYLFFNNTTPRVSLAMDGTPHFAFINNIKGDDSTCIRVFNFVYNLILSWESSLYG